MRFVQRAQPDPDAAARLELAGQPSLLAKLLAARGVADKEQAERFLHPDISQLHDPFLMHDMKPAAQRIEKAIAGKEKIVVFGDYDVDGVTATAVMLAHLRSLGADAGYYLPSRHGEGYGLNEAAMRSLASAYKLMITVDCGIAAAAEVAIAKECGMDVIVTDHHEPTEELPDCPCVNPKLGYPFSGLCGAGVAGKVVQAMGGARALKPHLDLIALGTIADIVPLVDENRVLASLGLAEMNRSLRPGLSALCEVAGLMGKELTSGHLSFMLAPRINAGGRMGHSGRSVDMLLEKNRDLALAAARELDESNRQRQEQERGIFEEALAQAEKADFLQARCLVLVGEGWNPGVIGIVASRMVERFARPVFLLAREGDVCVGSGRSVPGVSLFQALDSMGNLFLRYGGHDMAAGLTIESTNIPLFADGLQSCFEEYPAEMFLPTMLYDLEANLSDMNTELVSLMERLSPTGQGNPTPVFLLKNVYASGARTMGTNGAHLRMQLSDGDKAYGGVAFKMGERLSEAEGRVDVLITPEPDDFIGNGAVRMLVRAFEPASAEFASEVSDKAERLFCDFLSTVPYGQEPGGYRKHLPLRDAAHLKETAKRLLSQAPGGVLIACALPETALALDVWLEESGLGPLVKRNAGPLKAFPGTPHILQIPAENAQPALCEYRHILLADGIVSAGWVGRLIKSAPNALVYAPPLTKAFREAVAARAPDIGKTRDIYRMIVKQQVALRSAGSFYDLYDIISRDGALSPATFRIALHMLLDMELIQWREEPFHFALCKAQGKKDAEQTQSYRFYQDVIRGG